MARIGFMQGRLSPQVDGKIQAFPWSHWQEEFAAAREHRFPLMEWTLDAERLHENPLLTREGRAEIGFLAQRNGVSVQSLTADFFMQEPFHKAEGAERSRRLAELDAVLDACRSLGVRYIVIPLVDNGRMETPAQEEDVLRTLAAMASRLEAAGMAIVFECDYPAQRLAGFIARLPARSFGINYDIGNSAALGYDTDEELGAYGDRVMNVHVKDRVRGGTTVPLGTGGADLPRTFRALRRARYAGDFILQTARAADDDHAGALLRYRSLCEQWLADAARGS